MFFIYSLFSRDIEINIKELMKSWLENDRERDELSWLKLWMYYFGGEFLIFFLKFCSVFLIWWLMMVKSEFIEWKLFVCNFEFGLF